MEGKRRGGPKEKTKKRRPFGWQGRLVVAIRGVEQPSVWPVPISCPALSEKDKRRRRRSPWTTHPLPIREIEVMGNMGQLRHMSRRTQSVRGVCPSFSLPLLPPIKDLTLPRACGLRERGRRGAQALEAKGSAFIARLTSCWPLKAHGMWQFSE